MRIVPRSPFSRQSRPSTRALNTLSDALASSSNITATGAVSVTAGGNGIHFTTPNSRWVRARIIARFPGSVDESDSYSWIEVLENGDGTFADAERHGIGGSGDPTNFDFLPAYEENELYTENDSIVWMHFGYDDYVLFSRPSCCTWIFACITGGTDPYSWSEAEQLYPGSFGILANGRTGVLSAYELGGNTTVAENTYVWLAEGYKGSSTKYSFYLAHIVLFVRITSLVKVDGRYPAVEQIYDPTAKSWTDGDECWYVDANE